MEFTLTAKVTISVYTKVEAETLEQAIELSKELDIQEADYNGDNEKSSWVSDEYDGEVYDIEEVEE